MPGEAEEKGVVTNLQQTEPELQGHTCSVCNGPDHRACGCEARAALEKKAGKVVKFPQSLNFEGAIKNREEKDAAGDIIDKMLENREATISALQDIVEQLKAISETLKGLGKIVVKFPQSLN